MKISVVAMLVGIAFSFSFAPAPATAAPSPRRAEAFACPDGMAAIPGGSFELDGKKVNVEPFCLDQREVTAEKYAECVKFGDCSATGLKSEPMHTFGERVYADSPINSVTWAQAVAFCRAFRKRLPSAVEWQWAARGGPAANRYPWGNEPPANQLCWAGPGRDASRPMAVCNVSEAPGDVTPQGVQGMGGNVTEWTSTPAPEGSRLACGGSFGSQTPQEVSAIACSAASAKERSFLIGFRCLVDPWAKK